MSWQLVSVVVLFFAIGAGMLWYERSRPPSQIVALVAVLAALAVAGRIALAPIPNLVATTDIVIISGFVLGSAPGFAVGALGSLVSNFWLGQGVWTPWQMIAWGMCGVAGGVFWRLTAGRVNRWWLAAFCGAAGLAFGAWMNLQTMVSFGGEISLDRYLALEVRAIPFDIAHMTGNIIFALAAGPAMIAALVRFRDRFEWTQSSGVEGAGPTGSAGSAGEGTGPTGLAGRGRTLTGLSLLVMGTLLFATAGGVAPADADAAYLAQAKEGSDWLESQQNTDGGFASTPDGTSSVNLTTRTMLALAATGTNPLDVKTNATPYGYLVNNRSEITEANDIALTILAMKTVGQNPKNFKGRNLVEALRNRRGNGSFGNKLNIAAYAVLAFRSVGATKDAQYSLKRIYEAQNENGGWGIGKGANSESDSTGTMLMAITGEKARNRAIGFLDGIQKDSGGFGTNGTVNSQSTSRVLMGLVAQGRSVNSLRRNGNSGADYLLARQLDDGSFWYSRTSDQTKVWVTADSVSALAGKALPIKAPPREQDDTNSSNNTGGATPGTGTGSTGSTYTPPAGSLATPSTSTPSNLGDGNDTGTGNSGNNGNQNFGNPDDGTGTTEDPTTELPPEDTSIDLIPEAPSAEVLAASEAGPQPSPVVAILIALVVSGGLCGGTILLARRFRW